MSDKPGVLRNLRIKRVSLVDMGANLDVKTGDGAHIMLFKRADMNKDGSPSVSSVHVDSPDWDADDQDEYEKADLTAEGRRALPDSAFAAVWTDAQGKKHRKLPIHDAGHLAAARGRIDQANIPADVKAAARRKIGAASNKEKNVKKSLVEKLLGLFTETDPQKRAEGTADILKAFPPDNDNDDDDKVHKADNPMCKCADCMAKRTNKGVTAEEVTKAVTDAVAKAVAPLQTALAKAQTDLAAEVEKRHDTELRIELRKFNRVGIKDDDIPMLSKMKSDNPDFFKRQMEIFAATQAQLEKSAMWGNIGVSGAAAGDGSAWGEIEQKADALLEKSSSGNMTHEQALEKVMMDPKNAALVKRHRSEANGSIQ